MRRSKENEMEKVVFDLDDGDDCSVIVEMEETSSGSVKPVSIEGTSFKKATKKLGDSLDVIKPFARSVLNKIRELPEKPDQINVEFGVKLQADANAIIASTSVEGHIKVSVVWIRKQDQMPKS